ncbi:hypothetical protein [Pseudobacteroides cellulosolvens]|uniref:Uncharacterized protein n=1 Tax=Pseudobacteroides cellulosolvens ATCC 35603 = DSM 2933 TaxID=398512 RepID=A0A0L6JWX3_9FIRM|nr:hypothetical protein [Pseudobacteroides cellulosolvens]KNY30351.1 hypothetical protein Bccel_5631 [Pseudobacteroides cellulosolvens ATCC 35603 = DSM 2933]
MGDKALVGARSGKGCMLSIIVPKLSKCSNEKANKQMVNEIKKRCEGKTASEIKKTLLQDVKGMDSLPAQELAALVVDIANTVGVPVFQYENNPLDNPKAMADIILNPEAVYGFSPDPESTRIGEFASSIDWTNPEQVSKATAAREKYHQENDSIADLVVKMKKEDASPEEIAKAAVNQRNKNRLDSYLKRGDEAGYQRVLRSNQETYGNPLGMTPEDALKKYGSWEKVIDKTMSTNSGMDACCGLYDKYFHLYGI